MRHTGGQVGGKEGAVQGSGLDRDGMVPEAGTWTGTSLGERMLGNLTLKHLNGY